MEQRDILILVLKDGEPVEGDCFDNAPKAVEFAAGKKEIILIADENGTRELSYGDLVDLSYKDRDKEKGFFYPYFESNPNGLSEEDIKRIYNKYPNAIGYAALPEDATYDEPIMYGPVFASEAEAERATCSSDIMELDGNEFYYR